MEGLMHMGFKFSVFDMNVQSMVQKPTNMLLIWCLHVLHKCNLRMVPKLRDIDFIKVLIGLATGWWGEHIGNSGLLMREYDS